MNDSNYKNEKYESTHPDDLTVNEQVKIMFDKEVNDIKKDIANIKNYGNDKFNRINYDNLIPLPGDSMESINILNIDNESDIKSTDEILKRYMND